MRMCAGRGAESSQRPERRSRERPIPPRRASSASARGPWRDRCLRQACGFSEIRHGNRDLEIALSAGRFQAIAAEPRPDSSSIVAAVGHVSPPDRNAGTPPSSNAAAPRHRLVASTARPALGHALKPLRHSRSGGSGCARRDCGMPATADSPETDGPRRPAGSRAVCRHFRR